MPPSSPGAQPLVQNVDVARVSGITGTHLAANGDYHLAKEMPVPGYAWNLNGIYMETGVDGADSYHFRIILDKWYLRFGSATLATQTSGSAAATDVWDVTGWTESLAGSFSVARASAPPVPQTLDVQQETNLEIVSSPSPQTAEATSLSPGAAPPQTAEDSALGSIPLDAPQTPEATSLSPGAAPPQTAEATSLSPGAVPPQTAEAISLSPGAVPPQTAEAPSLSPGAVPPQTAEQTSLLPGAAAEQTAEATSLSPGSPGQQEPE